MHDRVAGRAVLPGHGYGTEARQAVLHLAFAGLGAVCARSASFLDNASSLAVSRKVGYRPDGTERDLRDGKPVVSQRFLLMREDWEHSQRPQVLVSGLESCLDLFGIDGGAQTE